MDQKHLKGLLLGYAIKFPDHMQWFLRKIMLLESAYNVFSLLKPYILVTLYILSLDLNLLVLHPLDKQSRGFPTAYFSST